VSLRSVNDAEARPTVGGILVRHVELAQTEITQCDMSGVIEQDVLWLQITITVSDSPPHPLAGHTGKQH
jgi:hypothetical protein